MLVFFAVQISYHFGEYTLDVEPRVVLAAARRATGAPDAA